jgi:hypothetical protein
MTMSAITQTATTPKWMRWTGRVITGLVVLAFLASATMKFLMSGVESAPQSPDLGWKQEYLTALAITEIACALIYAFPPTSVLGAILLTGYMGGAIATHARVGDAFIVPIVVGVLVWLGIYLRDARLWALVPLRR